MIPDLPGNEEARAFLASAPSTGLHMPLGKSVKVMQCWRCKQYGHRTGDRECPLNESGNMQNEASRRMMEDPMALLNFKGIAKEEAKLDKKRKKLEALQGLLAEVDQDLAEKKAKKTKKEKKKKEKKSKKSNKSKKKKKKKKKSSTSSSSDSSSESSSDSD